jgi:hypothetical protein
MLAVRFLPLVALLAGCPAIPTDTADSAAPADDDADDDGFAAPDDCDDADAAVNPDAAERCDGVDNDCDGTTDVGATDALPVFTDADGDTYGDPATATTACAPADGQVDNGDDCDDADEAVSPAATEVCNEADDDCDGAVDEEAADAPTWYPDVDGDGYGDEAAPAVRCGPPGEVSTTVGGDCDDGEAQVAPGLSERCDGLDNDCDPATPDAGLWLETGDVWTDATATVAAGTAEAPVTLGVAGGTVHVCSGTWYLHLRLSADAQVLGHASDTPPTLSAGTSGTAIYTRGDVGPIDVTVRDLDIVGSTGDNSYQAGFSGGGGVLCDGQGGDTLRLDDVTIRGGNTYAGGAVFAVDCDATVVSSTLSGNSASFGGGFLAYSVTSPFALTVTDSVIEDNTGGTGGGVYVQAFVASTLDLEDSLVRNNTASYSGAGVAAFYAVSSTCTGDASTSAGLLANTDGFGGAFFLETSGYAGSFTSTSCDFGAAETADENTPSDVYQGSLGLSYTYGDDATFTCDGSGCM